ncbi:hypothetical protein D3C81_974660 [compost metagenome]
MDCFPSYRMAQWFLGYVKLKPSRFDKVKPTSILVHYGASVQPDGSGEGIPRNKRHRWDDPLERSTLREREIRIISGCTPIVS